MSAKFKPKKKETEPIVDDWEAAESEEDEVDLAESSSNVGQKAASSVINNITEDAWGDDEGNQAIPVQSTQNGLALWQEANRAAPQAQPVVANRSLPPTVFSPRVHAPSSGEHQQYAAPPPPQILKREKAGYGSGLEANDKGLQKKTLKEREEEYRKARERIFGSTSAAASSESQANPSRPGSASGHSSGSGKHQQQKGQSKSKS